jgi:hypothetical protein
MGAMPALRGLAASVMLVVMGLAANGAAGERADPETVAALRAAVAASGWVRVIVALEPTGETLAPIRIRFAGSPSFPKWVRILLDGL